MRIDAHIRRAIGLRIFHFGMWSSLPRHLLSHIFSFFDTRSLLTAAAVCRSWSRAAGDIELWIAQFQLLVQLTSPSEVAEAKSLDYGELNLRDIYLILNRSLCDDIKLAPLDLSKWRNVCFHPRRHTSSRSLWRYCYHSSPGLHLLRAAALGFRYDRYVTTQYYVLVTIDFVSRFP